MARDNSEYKIAVSNLYLFYLEMERRNLDTKEGWDYLLELVEKGLPYNRVQGSYLPALRFVSSTSMELIASGAVKNKQFIPLTVIKSLFQQVKREKLSASDFITFYSTTPVPPAVEDKELELRLKSALLAGEDMEYFTKARNSFITVRRSEGPTFQIINSSWECIENLILAILFKEEPTEAKKLIAKQDGWLKEDRFGIKRFVKGAGKLQSEYANDLVRTLMDSLKKRKIWLSSYASLSWIRLARGNIVRGRTEYLAEYRAREKELCLKHLDAVFRELIQIYG